MKPKRFSNIRGARKDTAYWGIVNQNDQWAFGSTKARPIPKDLGFNTKQQVIAFIKNPILFEEMVTITFRDGYA